MRVLLKHLESLHLVHGLLRSERGIAFSTDKSLDINGFFFEVKQWANAPCNFYYIIKISSGLQKGRVRDSQGTRKEN
jgi:hypothetical protein